MKPILFISFIALLFASSAHANITVNNDCYGTQTVTIEGLGSCGLLVNGVSIPSGASRSFTTQGGCNYSVQLAYSFGLYGCNSVNGNGSVTFKNNKGPFHICGCNYGDSAVRKPSPMPHPHLPKKQQPIQQEKKPK